MMDVGRAVKETCGSLIEVVDVKSQKQVMAIHITLREFMQSEKATGPFAFSKAEAEACIARTCLNYLLLPQFAKPFTAEKDVKMDSTSVTMKHRLLNYGSQFWSYHLINNLDQFDPNMNELIIRFLQSRNVLTSIEAIATFGVLSSLVRISDDLHTWLQKAPSHTPETRQWISVLPVEKTKETQFDDIPGSRREPWTFRRHMTIRSHDGLENYVCHAVPRLIYNFSSVFFFNSRLWLAE